MKSPKMLYKVMANPNPKKHRKIHGEYLETKIVDGVDQEALALAADLGFFTTPRLAIDAFKEALAQIDIGESDDVLVDKTEVVEPEQPAAPAPAAQSKRGRRK